MTRMFMSYNPLDPGQRSKIVGLLNPLLATLADLSSQIHHAHWNVKGPDFVSPALAHMWKRGYDCGVAFFSDHALDWEA